LSFGGALGLSEAAEDRSRQHGPAPRKAGNTGLTHLAPDER
jgi:hypothetical protein